MVMPDDFLAALQQNLAARAFFETLDRKNQYAIYHRLQSAGRPETRERRVTSILARLARREAFH